MKIEIKLPDPKYCNGCPCLFVAGIHDYERSDDCNMAFEIEKKMNGDIIRPAICIKTNGE